MENHMVLPALFATRFVYTKLRLHPQQIIRVITTLLFAKFSHISQI